MVLHRKLFYAVMSLVFLAGAACSAQVSLLESAAGRLEGTLWQLNSYGLRGSEIPVVDGAQITMVFMEGNRMGGTDGCNTFEGEYEAEYGAIEFKNLISTRSVCTGQVLMYQDIDYLSTLASTDRYEVRGDQLIIWYGDERHTLIFTRAQPPGLVGARFGRG